MSCGALHIWDPGPPDCIKHQHASGLGCIKRLPALPAMCAQVRYLKVIEKSGYQALPWVRYITQAGNYEIRLGNS